MSAVNGFARDDGAWIIADTGSYDHYGNLLWLKGKVSVSKNLRMIVSASGRVEEGCVDHISAWLAAQPDQETALADLPSLLAELVAHDAEAFENGALETCGPIPGGIRLTVALWDLAECRARVFLIASTDALCPGTPPFTLRQTKTVFAPTLPDDPWPGHTFDPARHGQLLGCWQRQRPDDEGIFRVGGEFIAYRAHARGVQVKTLLRWNDVVGEPLRVHP